MSISEIVEIIRTDPLAEACEQLIKTCRANMLNDNSHADDLNVILFRQLRARNKPAE